MVNYFVLFTPFSGVGGYVAQDNTGHFGPFQSCKYTAYYSYCGGDHYYNNTSKGSLVQYMTQQRDTISLITINNGLGLLKTKSGGRFLGRGRVGDFVLRGQRDNLMTL